MDDKEKVIEAFKNSDDPLNAKKVSELSGVEKKEVDKIMKELKKDETIVSPKRCYLIFSISNFFKHYFLF
ncbi:MarR family transcriptional regulator [uncultured Methanobrevibacter sp.]|uniref:MarR family transcriptional regulator n=1 Tax=uncultured Methanobrevibacter sp. TaxID=253161 RepID=UPI0025EED4F9|nr:MarR family transcriptional regulator [uncultured Methanobrevibacter sp.]